jgi:phospholipase/lecithinase/hemolysin
MIRSRLPNFVASLIIFCLALAAPKPASGARGGPDHNTITRMYVFGDSYSDIGEGYRDGNGPTAVAYLAQQMGLQLMPANDPAARGQSLDFAISGAQTGTGDGHRFGKALLGVGMRNQVDEFAALVRSHEIEFDPGTTLFFFAGGLNDGPLTTQQTVSNLRDEIGTIYALGGRHFMVALLPKLIPEFSATATRLDPAIARIPGELNRQLRGAHVNLSHWGRFYDDILRNPSRYGITDTEHACAGRAVFHQDATPCASPSTLFYYHHGHPSTAAHKIVGGMLYREAMRLEKKGRL